MPNQLEQEFPEITWQAIPPLGPRGVPPEVIRGYMERGRRLHSRAIRSSARAAGAALRRGLVAAVAVVSGAVTGPAKRMPEHDGWVSPARGA